MENIILNALKRFRFLGIVFLFTYSYQINAQCGTPVVGCPGTDFGNFGYNSNNNSATIEYDNFVSTFHSTVVRDADGNFQVWGENVGHHATNVNSFSNLLDPLVINTTNFPGFTGTPLKAALGSVWNENVQGILLTTTGLHVWGRPGVVVATSLTTNWRMQPITVGGNTNGLPTGVTPAMVKMMFVTGRTIAITTCDGDAYVLSQNATLNQGGSSTAWTRVQDSSNNNLTGVVALRGSAGVMFALKSDNTLWTWGINTYLGDGSAFVATRNRAEQMTAPITGINIKMIGATFSGTEPAGYPTYYVLATDGNLYSMGRNNQKQIGDWAGTSTHRTSWVQPRYTSASGQVMNNIKWISPAEHDWRLGAINVITNNADLYNWGSNTSDRYMLGRGTTDNVDPGIPNGSLTDDILAVETGGHTTMITMKCTENFGYVGHRIRGSMGNGSGADANEQSFTFATAAVQICGAETIPIVNKITINMNSDGTVCEDGAVTLVPDVPGGTYSFYTAVPGSPGYSFYDPTDPKRNIADGGIANFSNGTNGTPGDSTNTLTFNGTGTVKVVYSVTGDCGPVEVVTTDFVVVDCVADLEITKSVSPTNANAGDTVTFTINVENLGPQRAKEVQVTELLPAGYTYVNHAVSTGSYNNTTGLWDGFYLIDGNSATLTVTATVNANGPYLNTATISSGTPDPNLTNNEDTAAVTIPTADLAIEKTVSNATPNVGDTITFTLAVTNNGTANAANVSISDVVPNGYTIGTINNGGVNTAGTIVWSIGNLANGATTTVTFTVTVNATGNYANTATVSSDTPDSDLTNNEDSVTTTPVTPNTTHAVNDINNTYANTSISGSVATNDFDTEGHTQTYTPIDTTDANGNHLVLNSDGTYTFTPGTDFTGTLVYTYTVCDNGTPQACDTATLTIEVLPLPEPSENTVTANNDTATTESGQAVNINVVANDFDMEGDAFTVTSNTQPANGTLVNNGNGTFTYTPNAGFEGVDTFTYTICDDVTPTPACDTATVAITVLPNNGVNDTYANDDTFNGNQGTVITGNVLTNDVDPEGNIQTVSSNTQPANGVVVMNPNTGEFTYTPNDPDFTGTDQFTYTVCDNGTPQACDTATVYITVNPVYIPQADLSIVKIVSNATPNVGDVVTFTLAVTNNGTDNAANVVISDVVPNGYTIGTINNGGVNTAGTITWTIANLANGANTTVTFTTTVNATGSYNNTATVTSDTQDPDTTNNTDTVTVTPANTTIAEDDINNTYVNTPVSGSVATNDKDAEGHTTTYTPIDNTDANGNHLVLNSDGTYTFTPGDNFTGTLVYTYTVCDNGTPQACDTATLTIEVLPLPEPGENTVTANHDTATTEEGQPVAINVVANDFDMESNTFTVTTNTNPTNGTVVNNGDGTFTYTPNPGFEGIDTFTYTICDDQTPAACDTATVTVTVLPDNGENDTYANDDAFNGNQGTPITGSVLTNDTDPEGNIQTVIGNTNPANGTVVMNPEGAFTYTPTNPNFSGTDQFTYTVCDNGTPQACDTATVYITVNPVTPLIELTKDGAYADTNGDGVVNVGDSIVYNFTVTNTGNVTVSNLTIDDAVIGVTGLVVTPSILAPGAVGSATTTYAITQANIDNGGVHNIATANGTDPNNNPVSDNSNDPTPLDPTSPDYDPTCPTCTFTDLQQTPLIELLKDGAYADTNGDGVVNVGDSIVYNFTVTNTGNVTVSNLTIDDAVIGVTGLVVTPSILAPGAVGSATTTYAITQANIDNGGVHNIATANGTDPNNNPVSDNSNDPTPLDPTSPDYDPTCPTCTFTDLQQTPLIELLKDGAYADTNGDGVVNVGDSIVYNFTVTNTGNVTVSNLTIDDAVIGVTGLVVTPSILAPGAVGSATTTYAITQANIDNGGVHNIATANGTDPNNNPVSDNSNDPTPLDPTSPDYDPTCPTCTFTDLQQTPLIELLKDGAYADTNGDGVVNVGDSIVYNFTVTNTGNVTVSNLTIDDAVIGVTGLVVTPSILAPGAVGSATTTYAITQANIDNGGVHNIATANGTDPNNNPVSDNSNDPTPLDPTSPDYDPTCPTCTFTDLQQTPLIELLKDGAYADTNGDGVVNVGDSIVYNFTVTNTGNVTVSNLTIDDAVIGVTGLVVTPSILAPGAVGSATTTYAITQANIDNGGVHNIATANGTDPNNNPVSDNSNDPTPLDPTSPDYDPTCPTCTFTDLQQTPLIELLKDGAYADTNGDGVVNVGDSIVYNFTVTNTGNVTVSNLTIDDAVIGVTGLVVTPSILAPGAVGSATTTYAITQANIDNGGVHNIATANGTDPNNNPVSDNSNDPTPLDPTSPDYDPTCPTCTFTDLQQTPLIELLKDGAYADTNGDGVVNVGDSIVYNFTVTNTGNVTVSNLTIDDAVIGVTGLVVTPSILAPGAVGSATTTYAITQANIDNGGVHNIATANGTDPNNNPVSDNSNDPTPLDPTSPDYDPTCPTCTFTDLQQTPLIELLKDGAYADTNGDGVVNVGDSIVYNFTVTNTGNVTVSNLTIDDAVIGVTGLVVTPSILAPGAVGSATTTYAITQANIDNGGVHNIATANGTDPNNNPVSDNSNDPTPLDPTSPDYDPTCPTCTFTDLQQTPLIELLKDGAYADTNGDGVVNVGDSIVYNFTVTNTGNVTVSNLTIDDAVIGVTGLVVTPSILAPGAVGSATTTYAITQANIDNGGVHNIATANGTDPNNNPVSDNSNDPTPLDPTSPDYDPTCPTCTFTDLQQTPLIELLKDGAYADTNGDGVVNVGDSIVYNFTVTNTGNVTVSNLTIDDAVIGVTGLAVTPSTLAPGQSGTATATYAITQADIDNGGVHNIATANGTDPNNNPVSDNSNDPTPLDPTSPDYDPTCPTCTFTDLQQTPLIELLKDGAYADTNGDGVVNVGDSIVYNFTVTNTGNVTVSNLTIDDAVIGVTGLVVTPSILAPGAVGSATTTYAITQANIDNGGVHNIATANGTDPNNNPVSDNSNDPTPLDPTSPDYDPTCPTCTFTDLQQTPLIELLKDGAYADTNGDGVVNVGDSIVYNFTVTNTGNVTVSNLTIDDAVIGVTGLVVTPSILAPGAVGSATTTYAITQANIDNGGVHNIATANGTDPNNNPVSDNSNDPTPLDPTSPDYDPTCPTCTFTDLQQTPLIELLKDGAYADTNGDGVVNVGDSIVYNFTVTNTGNVTVSNLTIDDAVIGVTGLVVTPSILAPGAVGSATTTYAITQANIDNGGVHNIATANGTDPNNNPVSDNSNDPTPLDPTSPDYDPTCPTCTFTDLQQTPLIELLKDGAYADTNGDGVVNVGDSIVYNFTVTNTGNVTVSNLTIDDAVIGVTGLVVTPSILAPGAVGSATTTYAITQANIDNGGVHNIATANGTDPNNNPVSDNSNDPTPLDPTSPDYDPTCPTCTFTDLQQTPLIELLKDGAYADTNGDGVVNVGDSIVYNFTVTNTGNVTVSNLTIDDAVIGVTGLVVTPSILAPGAVGSATTTYAITQANIDNGGVHNIATANGTDPNNNPVSDNSNDPTPLDPTSPDYDPTCPTCTFTDLQQTPLIELLKDGAYADTNGDGVVNVGDSIVYNFTVTNTGNVTVSNLTIDDAVIGVTGLAVTPSTLAPGQSGTATATYAITQADIDNGGVHNIATANGTDPNNNPVSDNSNDPTPLDPTSPDYDPTCPTCTFTDLQQTPLIELLKDGAYADTNGDGVVNVGDSIVYNFTVTNTGNVTVSNLTIDDAVIGVTGLVVTPSILAPGAVGSATTTYAITQANIDNGGVHNIATANGTDPNNNPVSDNSNDPTPLDPTSPDYDPTCPTCTFTDLQQTPLIELLKDGAYADTNGDGVVNVGDSIVYNFTVTNTGNVTVSNLTIDDAVIGVTGLVVTPSILAPGAVGSATTTYAITQANIDNGGVHNIATANGTDPNNNPVSDNSNDPTPLDPTSPDYDPTCPTCTFTDLQQTPLIELLKDGAYADTNGDGVVNVGDSIVYNFTVTNTGNVTVSNLTIDDAVIGVTGLVVTPSILAPGAVGSATTTYAITQANIDNGGVHNIATANGTDPNNNPVSDNSNDPTPLDPTSPDYDPTCPTCTFTDLQQTPLIELLKDGAYADTNGDGVVNVGDSIVYNFTVTNTGNVTVSNLTIDDAVIGVTGLAVTPSTLAPGQSGTATATYAITQADIDNGGVHNIATANGTDPNNNPVSDNSNDPTPLDPTSPDYDPTCPTCTFTDLQQTPLIELLKDGAYADTNGDGVVNVGDSIVYNFTVTNTGNVTVSNLTIDDAVIGVTGLVVTPSILAPGAVGSATTTYAITQEDIDLGQVLNIAYANGTDPNGDIVFDDSEDPTPFDPNDSTTIVILDQTSAIALVKEGYFNDENGDGYAQPGETITYSFVATNTGNTTLNNVVVVETNFSGAGSTPVPTFVSATFGSPEGTLLVGESATYIAVYIIVGQDLANGSVINEAIVTATDTNDTSVSDTSDDPNDLNNIDADDDGDPDDPTVIELPDGCKIIVNNGVSPNGDGINDYLHIYGLGCYSSNEIEIFNRWGVKVFETKNYENSDINGFKGISNGRTTINQGDGLPTGHYWYVLKYLGFDGKNHSKTGYIYVSQ